jgi:hypothetical protein
MAAMTATAVNICSLLMRSPNTSFGRASGSSKLRAPLPKMKRTMFSSTKDTPMEATSKVIALRSRNGRNTA